MSSGNFSSADEAKRVLKQLGFTVNFRSAYMAIEGPRERMPGVSSVSPSRLVEGPMPSQDVWATIKVHRDDTASIFLDLVP